MNGVHDMGGMDGFGPLRPDSGGPLFPQAWEARAFALTLASPNANADAGRHRMERIPAADYLAMQYYEKWLASLAGSLVEQGLVTREELTSGRPDDHATPATPQLRAAFIEAAFSTNHGGYARPGAAPPRFSPGDKVRARDIHPVGHTRLPRYVRGRPGTIVRYHGAHVFPDSHAHGKGEDPQPLYSVRFAARALWGEAAAEADTVFLDLWEPYLEPR